MYLEDNEGFFERRTDLPAGYSEWDQISKNYFGESVANMMRARSVSIYRASQRDPSVMKHKFIF